MEIKEFSYFKGSRVRGGDMFYVPFFVGDSVIVEPALVKQVEGNYCVLDLNGQSHEFYLDSPLVSHYVHFRIMNDGSSEVPEGGLMKAIELAREQLKRVA